MANEVSAGLSGRLITDGTLDVRSGSSRNRKYIFDAFQAQPNSVQNDGTVSSGVSTEINVISTGAALWEQFNNGTQTLTVPTIEDAGLEVGLDKTNNEGAEYTLGVTARSKCAFVVGTDKPFFARLKFKIADVSGTDDCYFGFRKAEAYQAAVDNYDEGCFLNVISGDVKVETILNNAATITTDTLFDWADNGIHELKVEIVGRRARFFINGVQLGGTVRADGDGTAITAQPTSGVPAFDFDAAEVVVPFFGFLHDVTAPGKILLREFECGYSRDITA